MVVRQERSFCLSKVVFLEFCFCFSTSVCLSEPDALALSLASTGVFGLDSSFTSVVHIKSTDRKMSRRRVQTTLASPKTIMIELPSCKAFTVSGRREVEYFWLN